MILVSTAINVECFEELRPRFNDLLLAQVANGMTKDPSRLVLILPFRLCYVPDL